MDEIYVVAGCKPWAVKAFQELESLLPFLPGTWLLAQTPTELRQLLLTKQPTRVFFLHWSWRIAKEITDKYECIAFHMTDLPYGRGGSPLQNLIWRGHESATLTVFRMTDEWDAGPVYFKLPLSLQGKAEEIYKRAMRTAVIVIPMLVFSKTEPMPQYGKPEYFTRRTHQESEIPAGLSLAKLYDFVRMLDAPTYPVAFLDVKGFRFEFKDAEYNDNVIKCKVEIRERRRT